MGYTKKDPCPTCGGWDSRALKDGRCWGKPYPDGWHVCMRVESKWPAKDGNGWRHMPKDTPGALAYVTPKAPAPAAPSKAIPYQGELPRETFAVRKLDGVTGWKLTRLDAACDAEGRVLAVQCRYEHPENGKTSRPWIYQGEAGWKMGLDGMTPPLFGLDELAARPNALVLMAEGPKAREAARAMFPDRVAVSPFNGKNSLSPASLEPLKGRAVTLWPDADADQGGQIAFRKAAETLASMGGKVAIVTLPSGLPDGWDLADPIPDGLDPAELLDQAEHVAALDTLKDAVQAQADDPDAYAISDETPDEMGMAIRFGRVYGGNVRYSPGLGWLVWDGSRFAVDEGQVQEKVTKMILALRRDAAKLRKEAGNLRAKAEMLLDGNEANEGEFKRLSAEAKEIDARAKGIGKSAKELSASSKIRGIMTQATSKPGIRAAAAAFDQDPWMLNVRNGMIDLRTGKMLPHNPAAMMTRRAAVDFDPGATAATWESFIGQAFEGDADLIRFVRQVVGYSLTGDTREQRFFILEGPGGNGKGVFLDTVIALMGDYSQTVRKDMVTLSAYGDSQAGDDLATLPGARIASINELDDGDRLNVSRIKELTGGETIAARPLYKQSINYQPAFKLWIRTNHLPEAKVDRALADRLVRIPFRVSFRGAASEDKGLKAKLMAELPGILNWAIEGVRDWQDNGLTLPQAVTEATAAYVADQDPISRWLDQMEIHPRMEAGRLIEAYEAWRKREGEAEITQTKLAKELTARGWTNKQERFNGKKGRWWFPPAAILSFQPGTRDKPGTAETLTISNLSQVVPGVPRFQVTLPNLEKAISHEGKVTCKAGTTRDTRDNSAESQFADAESGGTSLFMAWAGEPEEGDFD